MKFSRFNVWSLCDQGLILFNTLSCALALFDSKNATTMQSILEQRNVEATPSEFLQGMIEDRYLVDDTVDEFQAIRDACANRQSRVDEYSLYIILTMVCNFKCFYCFERHRNERLSQEEAGKVESMFQKICVTAKKIDVDWFGGEPLLEFSALRAMNDRFMEMARHSGAKYQHSITTNGYLLTDEVIKYFASTPLSVVAVTLDGPPDTHDVCRPLYGGGRTFSTILANITKAVRAGLSVSIRVNLTTLSATRAHELYHILEDCGLKNRVEVNIQAVVSSPANPCESYCLSNCDFAHHSLAIYKKSAERGWIVLPSTEELKALGFCVGEYPNRLITDHQGNLYRCGEMIEADRVGTLGDDGSMQLNSASNDLWVRKDPLQFPECRECPVLPICMGGCNMKRYFKPGSDYCLNWKHDLPGFLEVLMLNEENIRIVEESTR